MSMILYHGEPNGPTLTVLAAIFELGLKVELQPLALLSGARHQLACGSQIEVAYSIEGEGPVLVVNGEGMTDSVFLACYLDSLAATPRLRPVEPYARWEMMTWCRQIIERCAPAAALLGNHAYTRPVLAALSDADFAAQTAAIISVDLKQRWADIRAGHYPDAVLADCRQKIIQTLDRVETRLADRDYLMGAFSIADLESFAWLYGMQSLLAAEFAAHPLALSWLDRVRSRPSVQQALGLATTANPGQYWTPGPEINRWG